MKSFIVSNNHRRLTEYDTEEEARAYADQHNATCSDLNTMQALVMPLEEYVQQLEAAVSHMEFLHTEQKAHMKKLWKDSKAPSDERKEKGQPA